MNPAAPSPRSALAVWARVAAHSFGGPAGQIAVMHRILVEEKRWIDEARFLHALNFCMLLPGPEAQQLAVYLGWLLGGTAGGLLAGTLFVLPGFASILGLSILYAQYGQLPWVAAAFFGLKPAVLAVVVESLVRIGRRALAGPAAKWIAGAAFVAIFFFAVPFPWIVLAAGLLGWAAAASGRRLDRPPADLGGSAALPSAAARRPPSLARTAAILALGLAVWWAPIALLAALLGRGQVLTVLGVFFGETAAVSFGGAYAVLAYVAQQAVGAFHWLSPTEMLDGLGLAETTPGPLIQVVQFVAYLAAFRSPAPFSPWIAGILGSLVVTWTTFVPCFVWIFAGAPWVERSRRSPRIAAALAAITAAVVGVILNLAVWFSLHLLFARVGELRAGPLRFAVPELASFDPGAGAVAAFAFVALFRWRWGMLPTLAAAVVLGVAIRALVG
jgi:chromate transporter